MSSTVSPFQQRVYDALRLIPRGKVSTYAELARHLGIRSPRAIGQALKANPHAPEIPCHRIIRSDGTIGGYSGKTQGAKVARKLRLLESEGVLFQKTTSHKFQLAESSRWYVFKSREKSLTVNAL